MAKPNVSALADFCKKISQDYEQLRFILKVQKSYTSSVANYGHQSESQFLLYLIEHLDLLIFKTQQLSDKVENRLREYEA